MSAHEVGSAPRNQPAPHAEPADHELDSLRRSQERLHAENEYLRDALAELDALRDEYFELYDVAPLPLLTLTSAGMIRYANLAAAQLLSIERNRLLGHAFRSFVVAADRSLFSRHLLSSSVGAGVTCDLRLARADGAVLPVRLTTNASSHRGRTLLSIALVDQSEQQRLLDENRELLEATKLAQEANASKDQFIAMLSHELRTPLTPILAAASVYKDRPDVPAELRGVFERIAQQAAAEARLVDDLLDANGILRGKMSVEREPVDVFRVLQECVETARQAAEAKAQTLEVKLEGEEHFVLGDEVRLRQVFSNLLRNAVKFTPEAGRIRVRSWNRPGRLVVDVEDNGIGFEPAAVSRLFEPFDQLRDHDAPIGGLGLGLAISRGLVELHEGRIEAASRGPGRGARFAVELPTIPEPDEPPASRARPLSRPVTACSESTVLIVEDEPETAALFADLFARQGYKVVLASSVATALAVPIGSFDIVVSDLGLPDGTGTQLIKELQAICRCPAIALSGFGMAADVRAAKAAGFDLHLTKPVDMPRLFAAVQQLLDSRRTRR